MWRHIDEESRTNAKLKTDAFFRVEGPCTHARLSEVMEFGNKTTLSSSIHGD